jgi:hypothetical protein
MKFKMAAVALVFAVSSLTLGCMSDREGRQDGRYGRDHRENAAVSVDFGNVAFAYQDGYWDNGHAWHQWSDEHHRQSYRDYRGNRYNDWNHDRDGGDGWRQNNSR